MTLVLTKRPFSSAFENLTIHGFRHIFTENGSKFKRLFWILAIFSSTVGLFFYTHKLYTKLAYKPDISYRTGHVFTSKIPFPAITICTPLFAKNNLVDFHKASRKIRAGKPLNLTEKEQNYLASNVQACNPIFGRSTKYYVKKRTDNDIVKLLNESFLNINETFVSCSYNDFPNECPFIVNRVLTDRGFCFTLNLMGFNTIFNEKTISEDFSSYKRSNIKQSMYIFDPLAFTDIDETNDSYRWSLDKGFGKDHQVDTIPVAAEKGKTFSLNIFLTENYTSNICSYTGNVFSYYIHQPNEIMLPGHHEYIVEFRKKSDVILTAKAYTAHDKMRDYLPRSRGCYFEGEKLLKFFKTYTKALCEFECMTNYTLNECGCVKFSMPRTNETPVCTLDKSDCYIRTMNAWPDHKNIKDEFEAICGCLKTCNDIKYEVKLQKISTSENVVFALDLYNFTKGDAVSRISFTFDEYQIDLIEEYSAYTINNFVADVGGVLGFFLGCSILSLIEIVYFLLETCLTELKTRLIGMKSKKKNKKFTNAKEWNEVNRVEYVKPYKKWQKGIFKVPRYVENYRNNAY